MRRFHLGQFILWLIIAGAFPQSTGAASLEGLRTLSLVSLRGEKTVIGHVHLTTKDDGYAFAVAYEKDAFRQVYMEETNFLCLAGKGGDICQFPYPPGEYAPNDSAGFFQPNDLRPLEFALLFAERRGSEVDINPFNGLYYRLVIADGRIEGRLYAADFRRLIGAGHDTTYPLEYGDLDVVDPEAQRYPTIIIE